MKSPLKILISILFAAMMFVSCQEEDPDPLNSRFDHGVFIVNEGNFSDSDGSLAFYDLDSQKVTQKVFEKINSRPFAGLFQSLYFHGNNAYMVDQLGRIEVVDSEGLVSNAYMEEGLVIPRYMAASGSVGFVSDWGPYDENFDSPESRIRVIDLENMTPITDIQTSSRPEDIRLADGKLFVANSNTNLVTVYDPEQYELMQEIEVGYGPVRFVMDSGDHLWVICTGAFITSGSLVSLDPATGEVIHIEDLNDYPSNGRLTINGSGDELIFMTEQWTPDFSFTENIVYRLEIDPSTGKVAGSPEEVASGQNWYGVGVDPASDIIYISDAAAFQGNGTIYRYSLDGTSIDSFPAGRGPRDFVFVHP